MTKRTSLVHAIGECLDCGAKFQNYNNAQALSAKHAMKYGHKVTGEVGLAFWYDGRAPRNGPRRKDSHDK